NSTPSGPPKTMAHARPMPSIMKVSPIESQNSGRMAIMFSVIVSSVDVGAGRGLGKGMGLQDVRTQPLLFQLASQRTDTRRTAVIQVEMLYQFAPFQHGHACA